MTPAPGDRSGRLLEAEFRSIVKDFGPSLYRQAHRVLGNAEAATEAVQEILLNVHRSLPDFRGESSLATWVYRIGLNTLISYRRHQRREQLASIEAEDVQSLADEGSDVAGEYERKETREEIARCIAKLSPRESAAVTLFYMDGLGYKEIASVMETSVSAVGLLLHRGREHLHALLTGEGKREGR